MPGAESIYWMSASMSDVGKVRKLNEDAFLDQPDRGIWAVADGMGGHAAGDHASRSVVDALSGMPKAESLSEAAGEVQARLRDVNEQLFTEAIGRGGVMGSTVVALVSVRRHAVVVWAGDSRAYRLRHGQLVQLTRDHSRIQELVRRGRLSAEDAEQHPEANVITRAVGVESRIELDSEMFEVHDEDTFLLCSDGLTRYVGDGDIASMLAQPACDGICAALVERALSGSARDNVTAVVIRAHWNDSRLETQINPAANESAEAHDDDPTVLDTGR